MFQLVDFLTLNARQHPQETALVFKEQVVSWEELNRRVNSLARGLVGKGVTKGDTVAYFMRNSVELVLIWWATQKIGAIAQPLSTFLLSREIATCLEISESKVIVYQDNKDFRTRIKNAVKDLPSIKSMVVVGQAAEDEIAFDDLIAQETGEEFNIDLADSDGSLLLFTSGTTGLPKGVLRTQRIMRDYALMLAIEDTVSPKRAVFMTHCPLFHTAGMSILIRAAVLGSPLVLVEGCNEKEVLSLIEGHQVTQLLLVPPTLYVKLNEANDGSFDLSSIREAQCSGGVVSHTSIEAMHQLFPNAQFRFSWGSTETCSPTSAVITYEMIQERPEISKSIGRLNVMVDMKLIDVETGQEVKKGLVGEAYVRSSMVASGYLKDDHQTREAFDDEGWFKTNDLLWEDHEGYYYLVGRTSDLIKTGGENVYASEVEAVLSGHPAISEVAVLGVSDERLGEAVGAVIVLKEGALLEKDQLYSYCKERLSGFKKPRYLAFVSEIPRNSAGKLLKRELTVENGLVFESLYH